MDNKSIKERNESVDISKDLIKEYFNEIDQRELKKAEKEEQKQRKKTTAQILTNIFIAIALYVMYLLFKDSLGF